MRVFRRDTSDNCLSEVGLLWSTYSEGLDVGVFFGGKQVEESRRAEQRRGDIGSLDTLSRRVFGSAPNEFGGFSEHQARCADLDGRRAEARAVRLKPTSHLRGNSRTRSAH